VSGAIPQHPPFYRATIEVEVVGEDGRRFTRSIRVAGPKSAFTLRAPFSVRSVALDPHDKILRWTPQFRMRILVALCRSLCAVITLSPGTPPALSGPQ
jgi:hypothetical protein